MVLRERVFFINNALFPIHPEIMKDW